MRRTNVVRRIGMLAVVAAGITAATLAHAGKLDNPATIRITPLSKVDAITPKSGAVVFDADGIDGTAGVAVVSAFLLKAVVGDASVEVAVPEFQVNQLQWEAEPIGCIDDDPKTKCRPTRGVEYSGQAGWELPVYVGFETGDVRIEYGIVSLLLNLTLVDNKVRTLDGLLQITFSAASGLATYRVPIVGKLK
jgi:hypothetical protein